MLLMDEGALLPDVGIFDQVGIESHTSGHLLHGPSNLPLGTSGNYDSIEPMFSDASLDTINILRKAGQPHLFHMDNLSQPFGCIDEIRNGKALLQLLSTMAEENPYFWNLLSRGSLCGVFFASLRELTG